ncbi:hypothetical protein BABINDRAFT_161851 [Babjeviella inositovora NRRL Y-12698]|uniref:Uncharacterized protein n=1 Tax=Babjeviella inositovora NRRL Y-12698 TaxID=984486 RepID=A0A1E3QP38_9ASCO|nr:uncharacterized protein BABINDRAFT_161851 [Babjeviella inositovora NRRL Y-12698]ODQ79453.1 hypothetical protein BABINDRAFT_161851 [Babjeviella inositovora NRRL Y-12698]
MVKIEDITPMAKIGDKGPAEIPLMKAEPQVDTPTDGLQQLKERSTKQLHKPQFLGNSPLDLLFQSLEVALQDVNLDDPIGTLYSSLFQGATHASDSHMRLAVTDKLLAQLLAIQVQTIAAKAENRDIISIALHDLKTFSKVLNLLLVQCVYPALPTNVGIPLDQRRLKTFKKRLTVSKVTDTDESFALLMLLQRQLTAVFSKDGDVRDLLMKGTGYSDYLIITMTLVTHPAFVERQKALPTAERVTLEDFSLVEQLSSTYELFSTYSLLMTIRSPVYFKGFVTRRITHLPVDRADGVRALIEFIVGLRDGEDVSIERFDHVARIVLSKPQEMPTAAYFSNVCSQLYDILVLINQPVLTSVAAYVVEKLFERNKLVCRDFFFKLIWSNLSPSPETKQEEVKKRDEESKTTDQEVALTITGEAKLNNTINVLISVSKKSSSGFLQALLEPVLLPLWAYAMFVKRSKKLTEVVTNILVSFFAITDNSTLLDMVAKNLLFQSAGWAFQTGPNGLVVIEATRPAVQVTNERFFEDVEVAVELYIGLLGDLSDSLLQGQFLRIVQRWMGVETVEKLGETENPFVMLMDLRLLEGIGKKYKDRLARSPKEILDLVEYVLKGFLAESAPQPEYTAIIPGSSVKEEADSDDEDDFQDDGTGLASSTASLTVVLELLSAIITETNPAELSSTCFTVVTSIQGLLAQLEANTAAQALLSRINTLLSGEQRPASKSEADAKTLTVAITSLNDPLIPIRAHGLYLLRELVNKKSDVVGLDFVVELHLAQLKDPEPFIYLNVIKGLEALLEWDRGKTLPLLVDLYQKDGNVDERLRIGEVLLRFIQSTNEAFAGAWADLVVGTTLRMIRRDGEADNRMRMSAMSLLGVCCKTNPAAISRHVSDALDCTLGILQLEKEQDAAIMRRAAIVLVHDLIMGSNGLDGFPKSYGLKCLNCLRYITETDVDLLTREQAANVAELMRELINDKLMANAEVIPQSYNRFRI